MEQKIKNGIKGVLIGDAVGLNAQFKRDFEAKEILKEILDRIYNHGETSFLIWSDDGALTLATADALSKNLEDPYKEIATNFINWYLKGAFTSDGITIDVGNTTRKAIERLINGIPPLEAGGKGEWDNGNGSLMRILPASVYAYYKFPDREKALEFIHNVSAITHAHPRSKMGCGIYTFVVWNLLKGLPKVEAYKKGVTEAVEFYKNHPYKEELEHYKRVMEPEILLNLSEEDLGKGFYVVEALENALWSFLKGENFEDVLIKAISLGGDADTVGAIAGGLAGMYYGIDTPLWEAIKGRPLAEKIIKRFVENLKI
jgi:ADP-ribosyl-[dinitrogen reductase] hydrolase